MTVLGSEIWFGKDTTEREDTVEQVSAKHL